MNRTADYIPKPIRRPLGKLRAVFRRLAIWQCVKRELSGATIRPDLQRGLGQFFADDNVKTQEAIAELRTGGTRLKEVS